MSLTIQQIAEFFSGGQFEKVYPCLADNITWTIVGENSFEGKPAVTANCEQVAAYFKSVTTNFKTENIFSEKNQVAIEGTAEFIKDGKRVAFVRACDVYQFNNSQQLEKVTSYCIADKQ